MASDDEFYPEINLLDDDVELNASFGRFIIAWGRLEAEIDASFPAIFKVNPTLAICLYANLGTKAKLDSVSSALSMLQPALGQSLVETGHNLIAKVREYSGTARNTIAHGQPTIFDFGEDEPFWQLARFSARKALDFSVHPTDPEHWNRTAEKIINLARDWRAMTGEIHKILRPLTPDQIDDVCSLSVREILPDC